MPSIQDVARRKAVKKRVRTRQKPASLQKFIRYTISTVAPTIADNQAAGHNLLDEWLDTTAEDAYKLVNAVAGTWKKITP